MDKIQSLSIKVSIHVETPCRLFINGVDMDAVPGDRISVVPIRPEFSFSPIIEIRELPSKDEFHG